MKMHKFEVRSERNLLGVDFELIIQVEGALEKLRKMCPNTRKDPPPTNKENQIPLDAYLSLQKNGHNKAKQTERKSKNMLLTTVHYIRILYSVNR